MDNMLHEFRGTGRNGSHYMQCTPCMYCIPCILLCPRSTYQIQESFVAVRVKMFSQKRVTRKVEVFRFAG